jgi:undecaprenyl-diphosphatase
VVEHRLGPLDPIFVALTVVGSFGAIWIAIAVVLSLARRTPVPFMLVTAGVLTAEMTSLGLKLLAGRDRPYVARPDPAPLIGTPLDLSFPSGHSATAFAGATILAAYLPRLVVPLYVLAALVAVSRVYVGVHYPLDVVAGALLGTGIGLALVWLERRRPRARALRSPGADPPRSPRPPREG